MPCSSVFLHCKQNSTHLAGALACLQAVFTFPSSEALFVQWRRELLPMPGMRVNRTAIQCISQLAGKTVAGFKLRPYVRDGNSTHTALTGGGGGCRVGRRWDASGCCV